MFHPGYLILTDLCILACLTCNFLFLCKLESVLKSIHNLLMNPLKCFLLPKCLEVLDFINRFCIFYLSETTYLPYKAFLPKSKNVRSSLRL